MSENKPIIIALAIVGILIVGYLIYAFSGADPEETTVSEPVEIPQIVAEPDPVLEPEPEQIEETVVETVVELEPESPPTFILPRLDESDQLIRDGVVSLTRHEGINAWLSPNELARKIVVFVDNIANGNIAKEAAAVLAPRTAFSATSLSDTLFVMDESSYDRYSKVMIFVKKPA